MTNLILMKYFNEIVTKLLEEINNEVSQATVKTPKELFEKEKEYLLSQPNLNVLYTYLYPEKTYKGKRYSVPTKYIGSKVTIKEKDESSVCVYYNDDCIACHPISEKSLDDYDFTFQPNVNKSQLYDLAMLRFIENQENILFYGTPGVGKTHLATALGIEAASKRQLTYFISCHGLIQNLKKAHSENRLEARLKHYSKYKVLIIDEIGYLPIDKQGANLFFQLIAKRYEHTSTIITTNQPFSRWGDVFSDATLANAILDRLLHHSHVIKIVGPSYRTKNIRELISEENE